MQEITVLLKKELMQLEKLVRNLQERMKKAPKGTLRISKKKKGVEYYLKDDRQGHQNGMYIRKQEEHLAQELAQKDYNARLLVRAEERIRRIKQFLKMYDETDLSTIYQKLSPYRRNLINNLLRPDDEYVRRWEAVQYVGKPHPEGAPEIITEKGELVRSKAEKIIADKLYALGIPYRYECPVTLEGNITMYPDFTILRMPSREEVYLEHLGMMDDMNYVDGVMFKLNTYERNGIYLGVKLFVTYETGKKPLNTRALDGMLRKLFGEE